MEWGEGGRDGEEGGGADEERKVDREGERGGGREDQIVEEEGWEEQGRRTEGGRANSKVEDWKLWSIFSPLVDQVRI